MASSFSRLVIKTIKDIDKAQQRAARERERDARKAEAVQARHERDVAREEERIRKALFKEQVARERERVAALKGLERRHKNCAANDKTEISRQAAMDKASRQAIVDTGKKALEKRVKARANMCKRYIDSMGE